MIQYWCSRWNPTLQRLGSTIGVRQQVVYVDEVGSHHDESRPSEILPEEKSGHGHGNRHVEEHVKQKPYAHLLTIENCAFTPTCFSGISCTTQFFTNLHSLWKRPFA